MQSSGTNMKAIPDKHKISLSGIYNFLLRIKKKPLTAGLGLASITTVLGATFLFASAGNIKDSYSNNQAPLPSLPPSQLPAVTNLPSEINDNNSLDIESSNTASSTLEAKNDTRTSVTVNGEKVEANGKEAVNTTLSDSNGTTHINMNIDSATQNGTSSQTHIRSSTSSEGSSNISIRSEMEVDD